jgi:hypothetical protein
MLKFGARTKISGFKQAGTHEYIFLGGAGGGIWYFYTKIDPPAIIKFQEHFLVCKFLI